MAANSVPAEAAEQEESVALKKKTVTIKTKDGEYMNLNVGDMVRYAAIQLIGSIERTTPNLTGFKDNLARDELWKQSFDRVLARWVSIPLNEISPEASLCLSTAMIAATTFASNYSTSGTGIPTTTKVSNNDLIED